MGSYGLANKLTFYPSFPLYSYARGMLKVSSNNIIDDETMKILITLEPSKWHNIYKEGVQSLFYTDYLRKATNFYMVLGHNFEYTQQFLAPPVVTVGVVNDCGISVPSYNGWSLSTLDLSNNHDQKEFVLIGDIEEGIRIGSILYGKSWSAPRNVNLGQSYSVEYNSKQQKTVSGKTLSTLNYDKVSNWGNLPAWELMTNDENPAPESSGFTDYSDAFRYQRTGVRSWSVNFSMLNDSDILNQNQMVTSNGWTQDAASDYSTGADNSSLYNNQNSNDFMTSVYKLTMCSHLPVVVNISDSKNADQWAIVRITKFSMKESNPKLIDISMVLEEQV